MKNIAKKGCWIWFYLLGGLLSCDRMNDLHDEYLQRGESSYLSRIDSMEILPGKERAKLLFVNKDPKAVQLTIYWRSRTDSLVFPIPDNSIGKELEVNLSGLPEDYLTFELVTTNADGKIRSLKSELSARIYGDRYQSSLNSRLIDKAVYLESANELDITWKGVFEGAINVEIAYDDIDGNSRKVDLPIEERSILYLNKFDGNLKYRTVYVPEENAIDTFYTEYIDLPFSELYVIEGLTFNGINQYMTIADHPDLNVNSGEVLSISLWVKTPVGTNTQRILMKRYTSLTADPANGNTGYGIVFLNPRRTYADWYYRQGNGGGGSNVLSANNYHNLNEWIHLTAIFDSQNKQIRLYQNGIHVGSSNLSSTVPANPSIVSISDVFIGVWKESPTGGLLNPFNGEIAHLRFWKKALTITEMQEDMVSNVSAGSDGLVAAYDLRSVEGTGTNLTIPDITGTHTAVLYGYSRP